MHRSQSEGDQESARRYVRGLRRYFETRDSEADVRRAVPRAMEEASDIAVDDASARRRARAIVPGEYSRGARRRAAPASSP
jgi:hypothetical protein